MLSNSFNFVLAENVVSKAVNATKSAVLPDDNSDKIQKEIKESIVDIYGKDKADEIFARVMGIADTAIKNRPIELKYYDLTRADDWYKDEIIYMFYADQFGVKLVD